MTWVIVFPGQGSQRPGMLCALPPGPAVAAVVDQARAELGDTAFESLDTADALGSTVNAQLALFVAGAATAAGITTEATPSYVAGHSVGAVAAAVTCGALTFAEGVRLVRRRGELMQQAFPYGFGMDAVTGLGERALRRLVKTLATPTAPLYVAILNAPDQFVVAGSDTALASLERAGSGSVRRLDVAVPSHCPLLQPVADAIRREISLLPQRPLSCPYVSNSTARVLHASAAVLDDLAASLATVLRWSEGISLLDELGVRLFVEAAPGHVLSHLITINAPHGRAVSLDETSPDDIRYLIGRAAAD